MKNYAKTGKAEGARTELHDRLALTGTEISINRLPAGACVPFVHSHKCNEEVYFVLEGKGRFVIDGESVDLTEGDWIRISPQAKRQLFASSDEGIVYVCIQAKENSLGGYTATDAVIL